MPLEQWGALYQAVQANALEDALLDLSVTHSAKPKQLRESLRKQIRKLGVKPEDQRALMRDPLRLRRILERRGVEVEEVDRGDLR